MALAKEKIRFNGQCSVLYFTYGTMHAITYYLRQFSLAMLST